MSSKNPVLKNITDYLIEEASAEEEELLGMSGDQEEGQLGGDGDGPIERDSSLIKVMTFLPISKFNDYRHYQASITKIYTYFYF